VFSNYESKVHVEKSSFEIWKGTWKIRSCFELKLLTCYVRLGLNFCLEDPELKEVEFDVEYINLSITLYPSGRNIKL